MLICKRFCRLYLLYLIILLQFILKMEGAHQHVITAITPEIRYFSSTSVFPTLLNSSRSMESQKAAMSLPYSYYSCCVVRSVFCTYSWSKNEQNLHIHRSTNAWDHFLHSCNRLHSFMITADPVMVQNALKSVFPVKAQWTINNLAVILQFSNSCNFKQLKPSVFRTINALLLKVFSSAVS